MSSLHDKARRPGTWLPCECAWPLPQTLLARPVPPLRPALAAPELPAWLAPWVWPASTYAA